MTLPPEKESPGRGRFRRFQGTNPSFIDERFDHLQAPAPLAAAASLHAKPIDVPELFERFPYGLVLADREGRILTLNREARKLLIRADPEGSGLERACCGLICSRIVGSPEPGCLSERAAAGARLPEMPIGIGEEEPRFAWVTVSTLNPDGSRVLFHLRPTNTDDPGSRGSLALRLAAGPALTISTLGSFRVEAEDGPIVGKWLDQRPGQLLKYLVCQRRRVLTSDRIAEAIWNEIGLDKARSRIRYHVHVLRQKLEPDRPCRSPACFVVARGDGYALDTSRIWIDVDEFEGAVRAGLSAFEAGSQDAAANDLSRALALYRDDFLSEEPYLEWALEERERLRELAGRALRAKVEIELDVGCLNTAAEHARRLSDLEPLDSDVQRLFIGICLRRGKRSEATRRYCVFRRRTLDSFGQEPDFELRELEREANESAEP